MSSDVFLLAPVTRDGADWSRATETLPVMLPRRVAAAYACIEQRQRMWGETPFMREIARALGVATSTACRDVHQLVDRGIARHPGGRHRAILLRLRLLPLPGRPTEGAASAVSS